MPYATLEELKLRFGPEIGAVLDRDGDGQEDGGLADSILTGASNEIDAIIGVRFPVPVTGAPYLAEACLEIARYRLYDFSVPEEAEKRYQNTIKRLEAIAAGKSGLVDQDGNQIADRYTESSAPGAVYESPRQRVFTDDRLKGFMGP